MFIHFPMHSVPSRFRHIISPLLVPALFAIAFFAGQTAAPSEADAPARSAGGKGKAGRAAAAEDESGPRAAIEPKSQVQ